MAACTSRVRPVAGLYGALAAATSPVVTLEVCEPEPKADPFRDVLELVSPRTSHLRFGKAYGEQGGHGSRKDRARRRARQKRRRAGR